MPIEQQRINIHLLYCTKQASTIGGFLLTTGIELNSVAGAAAAQDQKEQQQQRKNLSPEFLVSAATAWSCTNNRVNNDDF